MKYAAVSVLALGLSFVGQAQTGIPEEGYNYTRVSGVSMLPTLQSGDVTVVFEDYPFSRLRVGDVVIMNSEKGYNVIHRIVRRHRGGRWITKGDNNRYEDREKLTSNNFGGLALVDDSIHHYKKYVTKADGAIPSAIREHVALANTQGTLGR